MTTRKIQCILYLLELFSEPHLVSEQCSSQPTTFLERHSAKQTLCAKSNGWVRRDSSYAFALVKSLARHQPWNAWSIGLTKFMNKMSELIGPVLVKAKEWLDASESNGMAACCTQMCLPSPQPLHVFLRSVSIRIIHHALCHFRTDCPQTQPSIITTEFYIGQVKEALREAIGIKVMPKSHLWLVLSAATRSSVHPHPDKKKLSRS
jgi:hypothetical protein